LAVVCGTECTPPKKKICLHIGHGKTGTSSIQSVLARAEADLDAANVLYPFAPGFEEAKDGLITSGNIPISDLSENWFKNWVIPVTQSRPSYKAYIFSSEIVFWCMESFFSEFENYRDHFDFEIVLCVRGSFDMFSSAYQQHVKRGGAVISFTDYLVQEEFLEGHAIHALAIVERLEELRVKVSVLNYSAIGFDIGSRVLGVMDVHEVVSGHIAEGEIVNRSLDVAELELILLINSVFGADAGARVSGALVNELPTLASAKLACPEDVVAIVKGKMQSFVDKINRRLPEDEQLSLEPSAFCEDTPRSYLLNIDQAATAYGELVNWSKDVLASSNFSSERLIPVAHLILLFLLASARHSCVPVDRQTLSIIIEECQEANCSSGLCKIFNDNQLLCYLNFFPAGDSAVLPSHIPISQKLNALTHAGLTPLEILDIFAIVHRVKLRVAVA